MFTSDFKTTPYWWERTPRPQNLNSALPNSAEVVIIGSGYTGLSAAIQTAEHGRDTVVVDAEQAGWGCSSRNGGQVSTSLKPTFDWLSKKFGAQKALAILQEGNNALNWIDSFVKENQIDCDFQQVGRFHAAHTRKAFTELKKKISAIPSQLNIGAYVVDADQQHEEIGSSRYYGGVVYPRHACIDPGRYHQGLLQCALDKGVNIVPQCKVVSIKNIANEKDQVGANRKFQINTSQGTITATDIIIATSGYTSKVTPWQQRRIIPIGTYMIATEPLPQATIDRLIPNNRVVTDTRRMILYYRTCPQRRRILFGGRVSLKETDPRKSASLLRKEMVALFPQLETARISHSWMGFVGYTFDAMPHIGKQNGMYYSMGYCGSGISLASYLGMRIGLQVANQAQPQSQSQDEGKGKGSTALNNLPFPSRPYYYGNPWFLAPALYYYRWRDRC